MFKVVRSRSVRRAFRFSLDVYDFTKNPTRKKLVSIIRKWA